MGMLLGLDATMTLEVSSGIVPLYPLPTCLEGSVWALICLLVDSFSRSNLGMLRRWVELFASDKMQGGIFWTSFLPFTFCGEKGGGSVYGEMAAVSFHIFLPSFR